MKTTGVEFTSETNGFRRPSFAFSIDKEGGTLSLLKLIRICIFVVSVQNAFRLRWEEQDP